MVQLPHGQALLPQIIEREAAPPRYALPGEEHRAECDLVDVTECTVAKVVQLDQARIEPLRIGAA
jgi:hypothetical protein